MLVNRSVQAYVTYRPIHRPDNVDRLDILVGTEKMLLLLKLKVLRILYLNKQRGVLSNIVHSHVQQCFIKVNK